MRSRKAVAAILIAGGIAFAMYPKSEQNLRPTSNQPEMGGFLAEVILPDILSQNAHVVKNRF
ncbi:hypothetical protein AB9F29_16075 [Falsihalocynthiibacter sp. S25ZX9]|uniref:hypothetical protein n=1 Tax=Falsihalocynthiibacter sp. S25ZX9 TaxID=3240870 RepID=UPI003510209F